MPQCNYELMEPQWCRKATKTAPESAQLKVWDNFHHGHANANSVA